jgi:hypothetical protein
MQWPARSMVAAGLFGAVVACSPALNWRELPVEHGIALSLPCKPERTERTVPLAGRDVRMHMRTCHAADLTWSVAQASLPSPADVGPALAELRRALLANVNGQQRELPLKPPQGMTPHKECALVDISGKRPDGTAVRARAQFVAFGNDVLQMAVLTRAGGGVLPADAALAPFFDSPRRLP